MKPSNAKLIEEKKSAWRQRRTELLQAKADLDAKCKEERKNGRSEMSGICLEMPDVTQETNRLQNEIKKNMPMLSSFWGTLLGTDHRAQTSTDAANSSTPPTTKRAYVPKSQSVSAAMESKPVRIRSSTRDRAPYQTSRPINDEFAVHDTVRQRLRALDISPARNSDVWCEPPEIVATRRRPRPATNTDPAKQTMRMLIAATTPAAEKLDLVPVSISCKCGHKDTLSNMFDCFSCSEYGLCAVCALKNHRMHELIETKANIIQNVVSVCSESNHGKLAKWTRDIGTLQAKGGESYSKLCDLLSSTFQKASGHENAGHVEELMAACDVSILKEDVKNFMEANAKMIESVDNLCDRLATLDDTEKPH